MVLDVQNLLREIAAYLDLEGDRFRARAYRRAATSLDAEPDLARRIEEGRLSELPGVGERLGRVITELARRGTVGTLELLRAHWPAALVELSQLPGVGAVRARRLHAALGPRSLEEIAELCANGSVRSIAGFGKVSEARLLAAIRGRHERRGVLLLHEARELGHALAQHLRGALVATDAEACGPARRWVEVVDRLAIAVATERPDEVRARLRRHPLVVSLSAVGPDLAAARLASGVACELHTAPRERFGSALIAATGSDGHLAGLRALARERGLVLERIPGADEHAVYAALGLAWLPPEVRDGTDEIEAARAGDRFDLVRLEDVTGAVHCHTVYSDGRHSIAQMAAAAGERGMRFLTITDHSASAGYAGGLGVERLREQALEIDAAQRQTEVRLLRGTESDILADGSLDYPPEVLDELEVVIASIHHRHRLDEEGMTRRLVAAMRQPCFKIWGHPLGRLLLRREPIACRFDEVLGAIVESRAAIELNGDPHRLDLEPERARHAAACGARFVLSTDAHSTGQLANLEYAVALARRARLRRRDVLNTLPPEEFAEAVRPRARRA